MKTKLDMKIKLAGLLCWWRGHHINGHKRRTTVSERVADFVSLHAYECSCCGRLTAAPYPVHRIKKSMPVIGFYKTNRIQKDNLTGNEGG